MRKVFVLCVGLLSLFLLPASASADTLDWSLKFDPGFSFPASKPQSDLFTLGGGAMVKALFGINKYLDVGPSVGVLALNGSRRNPYSGSTGDAWQAGGGFRFKRPYDNLDRDSAAGSLWVDADALYVRTDSLDRFGFAAAVGIAFPVDEQRRVHLGPFIRYFQIVQPERAGYDNRDAKILTFGLSLEVGSASVPPREAEEPVIVPCPVVKPLPPPPPPCAVCPTVPEPKRVAPEFGPVQFDWDEYVIRTEYMPVVDRVVEAMRADDSLVLTISGHASSEGTVMHNQILSENRAREVSDYIIDRGISAKRLKLEGYGSSVPILDNDTRFGREINRRVEFKVTIVESDSSKGE